jgi:RimJ/RimL family protein N-acetyltransferase
MSMEASPVNERQAVHDFSSLTLATPRLDLRPLTPEDAPSLFAICSDADVMRYGASPPWTDLQTALETIERDRCAALGGMGFGLGLFRRGDGVLIGSCSLFHIDTQCRRAEIGYILSSSAWGSGFATEAVSALLAYAFDEMKLNRIEADIDPLNTASARVLERQGFVQEGLMRERWIVAGRKSDSAWFGLLAADYEASRRPGASAA